MRLVDTDDFNMRMCMSSYFVNLRNFGPYWNKTKLELKAMIAVLGNPAWFLTLNPSERDWIEVINAYSQIYSTPENPIEINASNIRTFIGLDPIIWCRHFQQRLRSFMKHYFKGDGPLGEIEHFFYRIEYQQRGNKI